MKTPKLLPCPFCGKEPIAMKVGENHAGEMIECLTDGCVGPHVSYYGQNTARKKWNMRVCEKCGGLQGTDNFEMIAGTPCSCVPNSDARQGMVPAAELRPTIEFLKWIDEFLKSDGKDPFGSSRCRTRNELTRLETLLGEKEGK